MAKHEQEQMMADKGYITTASAELLTGKCRSTIYNWINSGDLECIRIGRERFIKYKSLLRHLGADTCAALGLPKKLKDLA